MQVSLHHGYSYNLHLLLAGLSGAWHVQLESRALDACDQVQEVSPSPAAADDECVPERHGSSHQQYMETTASP